MGAIENGGGTPSRQVDPVLWAEIHQGRGGEGASVYSVNAGWVTTHLASEHQMRMAPGKPRSALCGKSLPDAGEPWGQPMPHPPLDRPEKLCPKCLAMISPYAITPERLPDRAWRIEYGRLRAGEPLNQERHYVRPPPDALRGRLKATFDCWSEGQSAEHNAYAITNHGSTSDGATALSMSYNGIPLWDEERRIRADGMSSYVSRLEIAPRGQFPNTTTVQLLAYIASVGQITLYHHEFAFFTDLERIPWPFNSSCVLSRDAEDHAFAVTFIEKSMADARLARIRLALDKLQDSGDPGHPDHFVAAALNRRIDEHLRAGGTVTVFGEDGIGHPIVRAYAPKVGRGAEIRIAYRGGETAVAAADLRSRMARDTRRIQIIDADGEPLCIRFD